MDNIKTELYDTLLDLNTGERTIIHAGESNLIVEGFGILVACLLGNTTGPDGPCTGISWWAVGTGEKTWDNLSIEERQRKSSYDRTQLYNEVSRTQVSISFIDKLDRVSPSPTNRLEIAAIFNPENFTDSVGNPETVSLREFGIFGENATNTIGSGRMIDHKAHESIDINDTPGKQELLIRALRLIL